jgi:hypothetical protein
MSRYLNRRSKDDALLLANLLGHFQKRTEELLRYNKDKLAEKSKKCEESIGELLDLIFENVDQTQIEQVRDETQKMKVIIRYKDSAVYDYELAKKMDGVTPIQTEELYDICEFALQECTMCRLKGEFVDECKRRKLFIKYHIEPVNYDVSDGKCPYQYL